MKLIFYLNLFLLTMLLSCAKSTPSLEGIDLKIWIEDKHGCMGKRYSMKESIEHEKEKLLGLSEVQLVDLLGGPDNNELYKRNQKFYYYFIQPSSECAKAKGDYPEKLVIRFNAIGLSNDVSIE